MKSTFEHREPIIVGFFIMQYAKLRMLEHHYNFQDKREPIIVGFFIMQYAKLRMLEHHYNFLDKFCDVNNFNLFKMDTDSIYLDIAEENIYDCPTRIKRYLGKIK